MEAFFSSVKTELRDRFETSHQAKAALFDYVEVFYNQRRRHSTLGQISPAAFERRAARHNRQAAVIEGIVPPGSVAESGRPLAHSGPSSPPRAPGRGR
jgi:hypothetical protein